MQTNFIPKGYRLTVHSWENDGDAECSRIHEGLTKEELEFAVAFILLFRSKSDHSGCFGNVYDELTEKERNAIISAVKKLLKKHPIGKGILSDVNEEDEDDEDEEDRQIDCIINFLESFTGYGEFTIRVVADYKIDYFDKDVEYVTLTQKEIKDHEK